MMKLAVSIGLLLAVACPSAWASDAEIQAEFREAGRKVVESLLRRGHRSFGQIQLNQILATLDSMELKVSPWVSRPETGPSGPFPGTARNSAEWKCGLGHKDCFIEINRELWRETPREVREVLALHELLGAVGGIDDGNYEASSAMWFIAGDETRRVLRPGEIRGFEQRISAQVRGDGGIVGVGGGGDFFGLYSKMRMLKRGLSRVGKAADSQQRREEVDSLYAELYTKTEIGRSR